MKHPAILSVTLFIFVTFVPGFLSAQSPSYFPNTVIVKFETDERLQSVKAKTGEDPRQRVREFLQVHGVSRMEPVMDQKDQYRIQAKARLRSLAPKEDLFRVYQVRYLSNADPAVVAAKISKMPGVEYAEPKYIRHLQQVPNDPIDNPYLEFHRFDEAWDITTGDPDVIIAIVDGGVGYTHRELDEKMWINEDEIPAGLRGDVDQDGDGSITSGEVLAYLNEDYNEDGEITLEDALHPGSPLTTDSDTDDNGFDDDLFGWNFWASGGLNGDVVNADNNPIHDATAHGTHVAGIAAAETNNEQGIYSTGYDVRYMAVKAGGTPNNPTAIGFGFEGIIYAAEAGAHIINCSWGGAGFSRFEEEVIEFATSMGSLVIAAAGNESTNEVIYPAAFDHALGVGSIEPNNQLSPYTNYGYNLDVLATGTSIQSTVFNNAIEPSSGTSMATPVVSGLAGLIKSRNPDWSPLRIATQIRATARPVGNNNAQLSVHRLGKGKIDAFEAVNTNKPGLMVESVEFVNQEGDKLVPGEEGLISVTLVNYGNTTNNLTLNLSVLNQDNINLGESTLQVGSLGTDEAVTVAFGLLIPEDYDLSRIPVFRLNFADNANQYNDFSILQYQNLLFDVVDVNDVITSFAADGTIGFTEFGNLETGVGFIPLEPEGSGDNVLFEGGLMMLANDEIYDVVRSTGSNVSRDFQPEQVYRTFAPGIVSDQDGFAQFSVSDSANGTFATIDLETYAFDSPGLSNVVYVKYTVTNVSEFALIEDMYLGIFNDWDLGINPSNNGSSFSAPDSILYVFDEAEDSEQPLVATAHLSPVSSALGINNAQSGRQDSVVFGLYDGYTDEEKEISLVAGIANTDIAGTDISAVVGSGPYTLEPRASIVAGFIYAFGGDLESLRNQIENARAQAPFETSGTGVAVFEEVPETTRLFQNYPNPFSGTTNIRLDLEESSDVELAVYDVLGRKVMVLVDQQLEARTHIFTFSNERLSSGVYFARLKTSNGTQTIPMTLIK